MVFIKNSFGRSKISVQRGRFSPRKICQQLQIGILHTIIGALGFRRLSFSSSFANVRRTGWGKSISLAFASSVAQSSSSPYSSSRKTSKLMLEECVALLLVNVTPSFAVDFRSDLGHLLAMSKMAEKKLSAIFQTVLFQQFDLDLRSKGEWVQIILISNWGPGIFSILKARSLIFSFPLWSILRVVCRMSSTIATNSLSDDRDTLS